MKKTGKCGWLIPSLVVFAISDPGLRAGFALAVDFDFEQTYVDVEYGGNGKPGWVQVGDVDNDCDQDIMVGGGNALYIYENDGSGAWPRHGNLDATGQIGCNGAALYDVDQDGDLDVVAAKYLGNLGWWENPGGTLGQSSWPFHSFASGFNGWFLHDMIRADLNLDGVAEEFIAVVQLGYWDAPFHVYWYRPSANPFSTWESHAITINQAGPSNNHSGIDTGDIDGDGDIDVAFCNGWFQSSGNPAGSWTWRSVTNVYGISNTLIRDVNGDGQLDLVMSGGHHGQGVYWFEHTGNPVQGPWIRHDISNTIGNVTQRHWYSPGAPDHLHHPEGLQVADLDLDGDLDVLASELFFGEDPGEPGWNDEVHNLYIFENLGGDPPNWSKRNIAPGSYPSHLPFLADLDADRRPDVVSESAGTSVISHYANRIVPAPTFRIAGDFDCNGVIDSDDFIVLVDCMAGPETAPAPLQTTPAECLAVFDLDDDGDNDLMDFMALARDVPQVP
jgi:hypothetical protein